LEVSSAPVTTPPVFSLASPVYGGTPVTISETAGGPGALTYQWQTDNGSGGALTSIGGATSTNVVVAPTAAGTYAYDVVVNNSAGSVTSSIVDLTVLAPSAPLLTQDISPSTNVYAFENGAVSFNAAFNGTLPITYRWLASTNGSNLAITGATNNSLTLTNLQTSAAGTYELAANNSVGNSNSSVSVLNVLADPPAPTSAQPYDYAVLSDNPVGYWRLSETNDTLYSSMQAYDYSGHNLDGTYGSGVVDNQGGQSSIFPGFQANNNSALFVNGQANSSISVPSLNLNTNTVTITAWINPNGLIGTYWGLFTWRGASNNDAAGFGFGGQLSGTAAELGYTWDTNSPSTYGYNSGLYPPLNQWSFVALTITPTNTSIYLYYVNGGVTNLSKSVQSITNSPEQFSGGTIRIGSDNGDYRDFQGNINEVAVFAHSLNEAQIQHLFLTALGTSAVAPTLSSQPANVSAFSGLTATFTASGGGAPTPSYQWQYATTPSGPWSNINNGGRFSGATSSQLTLSSTLPTDNELYYQVILANSAGSVTSSPAQLSVVPVPMNGKWTINYAVVNGNNGFPNTVYSGPGLLGTGSYWNGLPGYPAASAASTLLDDGVTPSDITATFVNPSGEWAGPPPYYIQLLFPYVSCSLTSASSVVFTNLPNGTYNLALYGIDAGYNDRAVQFTVNGISESLVNVQGQEFVPGDNTALYSNVVVTAGAITANLVPIDSPQHVGNNEGEFNGAQLQLIQAFGNPVSINRVTVSGGNINIQGASVDAGETYQILSATNINAAAAAWLPVASGTFAGAGFTNSLPVNHGEPRRFYKVVEVAP
jgi:hypothetical protein